MRLKFKSGETPLLHWPIVVVAAGIGLYAAQRWIEHLPPNCDVAGMIVSALGILAGWHKNVRGDLQHLAGVYERLGGQRADHSRLEGQVSANKAVCDRVAKKVDDLVGVADDHAGHLERLIVVAKLENRDVARPMLSAGG